MYLTHAVLTSRMRGLTRSFLHAAVVGGLLLNMLLPLMAYGGTSGAAPGETAESPLPPVLGSSLLPSWVDSGRETEGTGVKSAPPSTIVNHLAPASSALAPLYDVALDKTGPVTVAAGSLITYSVTVQNFGPGAATGTIVTDTMPFQVDNITATYYVSPTSSGVCGVTPDVSGDIVVCNLGTIPNGVSASIVLTGTVDPDTPHGADLNNQAELTVTPTDDELSNNAASFHTEVLSVADVVMSKTGPATVIAGEQVTYTIVLTNTGPSTVYDVDVKDVLPSGVTFVSGSSTQGTCVSSICQLGDVSPGAVITMVITATVGSHVTGTITNTVNAFALWNSVSVATDSAFATSLVATDTAIQINKSDLTDPVYAGDTFFYEIVITNTGPSDALNVVVSDQLPAYVTFQGASPECSHDGSPTNGIVTCSIGTLAAGAHRDFLINTRVLSNTADNTIVTNYVTATTTTTSTLFTDSAQTTFRQKTGNPTDLALTKSVTPTTAVAGSGTFTYTLVITNNGPAPATAVQVIDAYPRQFDFVSATASDGSTCNSGMTCDLDTMTVGEVVTITLVTDVPSDVATGTYTNTATVGSAAPDTNTANNTASVSVSVTQQADLQLRKVANPDPATPGQDLTFTIIVTNTGPSDADNVTVSDTLPGDFMLSLVTSSQGGCASLPCNLGTLPAGGNADITVNGVVTTSATSLVNTATVTATQTDPNPADNTDTITPTIIIDADLALDIDSTPTVNAGESIVITHTLTNNGPSDAQNVVITTTLPPDVTVDTPLPSGWTDNLDGTVSYTTTTLSAGSSIVVTFSVTTDPNILPGTSLEFRSEVDSDTPDSDPLNNTDDADTSITSAANVEVSKSGPSAATAGEIITYTILVTNTGPSTAYDVDVKDVLPAGVTYVSGSSTQGTCVSSICQFGSVSPNTVITAVITATVGSHVTGTITNTVNAFALWNGVSVATDTAYVTSTINTSADVSVAKADLQDPVGPTDGFVYELVVSNAGPSDAQSVVMTDTLDGNVTFAGASTGCINIGSDVVCTVGTLAAGASANYLIAVTANDVPSGTILNNTVVVTSTTADPTPGNNSDSEQTTVQELPGPTADLAITKSGAPATVIAGQWVTYTLTVTNAGPQTATNVQVLELVPADTTVIAITAVNPDFIGEYCALSGFCYLGTVYTTTVATVTVVLQVDPDFSASTLINTAHVSADQRDPDTGDNIASETTAITTSADLSIAKADLVDPVIAGEVLLYQIRITNTGPSDAVNVVVTDSVPANTTFAGASDFCTESGGTVTCSFGTVPAGQTRTAFIQVRVDDSIPDPTTITNTATVSSSTSDPDTGDNSDTETTTASQSVLNPTDLAIVKSDDPDPVYTGQFLTYTLAVTNNGPAPASNVQVVDLLPNDVTFVSITSTQGLCNSGITCDLGDLAVGASARITVVVTVDGTATPGVTNFARVSASNPDSTPGNNEDSEHTTVIPGPAIEAEKTDVLFTDADGDGVVSPGDTLLYEITIVNNGVTAATGVTFNDTPDSNTTLVVGSVQTTQGTVTSGNGLGDTSVAVNVGIVPAAGSVDISFQVTITKPWPSGVTQVANQGTVGSNELPTEPTDDPDTGPDDDPTATPVIPHEPSISLAKILVSPDPTFVAQLVTFTVRITNTGNTPLATIPLTDTYDTTYLTFVSAVPQPDVVVTTTGQLIWNDLTGPLPNGFNSDLAPNATFVVQVVLKAIRFTPDGVEAENTAVADGVVDAYGDPPAGIPAEDSASVAIEPNIEVRKDREGTAPIDVGDEITFTVQITNITTADIVTLPVTDTYDPAYLSFAWASPTPDQATPGTIVWNDLTGPPPNGFGTDLAPGNSFILSIVFTATAPADPVTNTLIVEHAVDINGEPISGGDDEPVVIRETPTSAVLRSFTATPSGQDVTLRWETVSEIDNLGFNIWRSSMPETGYQRVNPVLIPSQALGTGGARYEFVDRGVPAGTWYYKLESISTTGQTTDWHGPVSVQVEGAGRWRIYLPLVVGIRN